jgi:hypothetical protein
MRRERITVESMLAGLKRSVGTLLLLTAMVFTVVSCSGSDDAPAPNPPVPPQPGIEKPIVFSGNLSEGKSESHARTRAGLETILPDGQKNFKVWTVKNTGYTDPNYTAPQFVMWNYNVKWINNSAGTTTSNTDNWEYVNQQESGATEQSIKYWDYDAKAYRFFGYAGTGVTVDPTTPASNTTSVSLSFTVPAADTNPQSEPVTLPASPYYSKLWFSTGNPTVYPNKQFGQPVQLEFLKPYVKVRFLFRQSESAETVFVLTGQSFKPTDATKTIATAGTFSVTYHLTGTATEESWSVTDNESLPSDEGFKVDDRWYVVLPAKNQGTYTLSVSVNNDPRTVVVPAQYMEWQPGYEYTYIFKITDAGGVELESVQAGFNPWTVRTGEREIYNW